VPSPPRTDQRPIPRPDEASRFFWEGARDGRLLVQRCANCGSYQYPPDVACIRCQSQALVPTEVSGRGSLYSFAIVDRAFHEGFVDALPYVVALVDLPEQAGLRMLTNIVEAEHGSLRVGMPLEVVFEPRGDIALPQFRPVAAKETR
jgi:uncharacterized OB-fold protein